MFSISAGVRAATIPAIDGSFRTPDLKAFNCLKDIIGMTRFKACRAERERLS